jgi:hypothetical protein
MKSLLIASLIILCSIKASAQSYGLCIYGEVGGGAYGAPNANANGLFQMTLNVIFGKNNIFSLSFYNMAPQELITIGDPPGTQAGWTMWGLSYGKVFFLNTPSIRFTVKAGIASDGFIIPANNAISYGGGYYSSTMNENVFGFVFDPTIEFPLSRAFGFSIGPYVNINSVSNVIGLEASMMFGKIRGRKDDNSRSNRYWYKHY